MTVGGSPPYSGSALIAAIDAAIAALQARGFLTSQFTDVGNVGGGTDDLMSYSLPANTLDVNGRGVRITAWGRTANNGNAKTLRLVFGAQVYSYALTTGILGQWKIVCDVIRTSSGNQKFCFIIFEGGFVTVSNGTLTQTDTAAITIKCTGNATSNNDIVQEGLIVESLR